MPTETRTVPTGTITDAEQLQRELNVQADLIGAYCTGVGIYTDASDDTLSMDFDATPDDTEVDNVIAAYPTYTPGLITPVAMVSDTWIEIWRLPIAPGERVQIDASIDLTIGDGTDFETATVSFHNVSQRLVGEATCTVTCSGVLLERGGLPQAQIRCSQDGVFTLIEALSLRTGTATVGGTVDIKTEIIA